MGVSRISGLASLHHAVDKCRQPLKAFQVNPILERGNTVLQLFLLLLLLHTQGTPPPNSAMGWTGTLWSNRGLLILEN